MVKSRMSHRKATHQQASASSRRVLADLDGRREGGGEIFPEQQSTIYWDMSPNSPLKSAMNRFAASDGEVGC
jgi:hypothetical protein